MSSSTADLSLDRIGRSSLGYTSVGVIPLSSAVQAVAHFERDNLAKPSRCDRRSVISALRRVEDDQTVLEKLFDWACEKLLIINDLIWSKLRISPLTSWLYPLTDRLRVKDRPDLQKLHRELAQRRKALSQDKHFYDYGHSYFYQSLPSGAISGRRSTKDRLAELQLPALCNGRRVLDLGCNVAFLALELSKFATTVDCVDFSPHVIGIGEATANLLERRNMSFRVCDYLDFLNKSPNANYDVILLLSAHISFDRTDPTHMRQLLVECRRALAPRGILVFESHPAFFENRYLGMARTFSLVSDIFNIVAITKSKAGTMLDRGRVVAYCCKD